MFYKFVALHLATSAKIAITAQKNYHSRPYQALPHFNSALLMSTAAILLLIIEPLANT